MIEGIPVPDALIPAALNKRQRAEAKRFGRLVPLTLEEAQERVERREAMVPPLPPGWRRDGVHELAAVFRQRKAGLLAFFSIDLIEGHWWIHVSASHVDHAPSWRTMVELKDLFIGPAREAVMVIPRADRHVSIHDHCHHLWARVEGSALPDFSAHV